MGSIHNTPGGDLISQTMSGSMGASSAASDELMRRAGMGSGPQSSAPLPTVPLREYSPGTKKAGLFITIAAMLCGIFFAFRSAITQAAQGHSGMLWLVIGTFVGVTCLIILGKIIAFIFRFLMAHKLLTLGLLCAGGYWAYLAISSAIPKPDLSPVYVQHEVTHAKKH
jgi:hypothetical protein